ncbi:MAG TPA: hypothetical protein VLA36_03695 [Longimicrobiales bacterium]|nr:hypothetical protein [Longimicrobiales bacterium]
MSNDFDMGARRRAHTFKELVSSGRIGLTCSLIVRSELARSEHWRSLRAA